LWETLLKFWLISLIYLKLKYVAKKCWDTVFFINFFSEMLWKWRPCLPWLSSLSRQRPAMPWPQSSGQGRVGMYLNLAFRF
jgi:hypothetical protein